MLNPHAVKFFQAVAVRRLDTSKGPGYIAQAVKRCIPEGFQLVINTNASRDLKQDPVQIREIPGK